MRNKLFENSGVHAIVDGQFGSTGKGALAAWLAQQAYKEGWPCDAVLYSGGPNSGHTSYGINGEKHVLKQLPTFAVASLEYGRQIPVYLTAGAMIDPEILADEARRYPQLQIYVHDCAAVVSADDRAAEGSGTIQAVAGTRSGTGAALARKVQRDPKVVAGEYPRFFEGMPKNVRGYRGPIEWKTNRIVMEVAQGFSLGLNDPNFYPKVTSRECTVSQGLSDARLPPSAIAKVYMSIRTYPIRVGNFEGFSSGGHYPDQEETTWEALGQTPELTTVTKRVRRVFTFSEQQVSEAINANDPDYVFVNFMNYLTESGERDMLETMDRLRDASPKWWRIITGYGPENKDIVLI